MPEALELGGLAVLGVLGSVCAILLRSVNRQIDRLAQLRQEAEQAIGELQEQVRTSDEAISRLQALCANYRYHIGALRADRKQLREQLCASQEVTP